MNRCQMALVSAAVDQLDGAATAKLVVPLLQELVVQHYCYCQVWTMISPGVSWTLDRSSMGSRRKQSSTLAHLAYALLGDRQQLACFEVCSRCSLGDNRHLLVHSHKAEPRMRTVVLVVEAQKSMAHTESGNHCCTASSMCRGLGLVVVGGAVQIAVAGLESSTGCHIEFAEYCRRSVEAIRSLLDFHKTALALSPMVFVVGKPLDYMVDVTKSCCLIAARSDYTAKQLVADIVIVCEQIAADCM